MADFTKRARLKSRVDSHSNFLRPVMPLARHTFSTTCNKTLLFFIVICEAAAFAS